LIRCERTTAFRKNEYKQDMCSDYSDRIITSPFPIAYPIEYSTKILLDFVQLKDFKRYLISKNIVLKKSFPIIWIGLCGLQISCQKHNLEPILT